MAFVSAWLTDNPAANYSLLDVGVRMETDKRRHIQAPTKMFSLFSVKVKRTVRRWIWRLSRPVCLRVGGHHQDTKVRVNIRVKDVNDNPPEFANDNEVLMCESVMKGKVRVHVRVGIYRRFNVPVTDGECFCPCDSEHWNHFCGGQRWDGPQAALHLQPCSRSCPQPEFLHHRQ